MSRASPSWLPDWTDDLTLEASPWLLKCFEGADETTSDDEIQCHGDVLRVRGQILGPVLTERETEGRTPFFPDAKQFFLRVAWHLSLYSDSQDVDERPLSDNLAYGLAALWSMPMHMHRYPKVRQWYVNHLAMDFASINLRKSVTQLGKLAEVSRLAGLLFTPGGLAHSDHDPDHHLMRAMQSLEASVVAMLRHRMKLCGLMRNRQFHLVLVRAMTQGTCYVARLQNCSLPVVLCAESEGKYSLVGEVVEDLGWHNLRSIRFPKEKEILQGFKPPPDVQEAKHEEELGDYQDDGQDGRSVTSSVSSSDGDEDRCWFGVDKEPWTEVELA